MDGIGPKKAIQLRYQLGRPREFSMEEDGTIFLRGRLCVPQKAVEKMVILRETHRTPYMVHLGETKCIWI